MTENETLELAASQSIAEQSEDEEFTLRQAEISKQLQEE